MGCPYIEWKELHSRWKSTAEKPWAPEELMGVSFEASVQPVCLCPNCSRWDSDTVSRLASLHRCMQRRGIGSTGAEEVHWSTQTSVLEQSTSNAPVLWFWSVGSTGAEEKLKSTKTCSLEQRTSDAPVLWFRSVGSTGAEERLKSTKTCSLEQGTSIAPVLIFWPSVQPVLHLISAFIQRR